MKLFVQSKDTDLLQIIKKNIEHKIVVKDPYDADLCVITGGDGSLNYFLNKYINESKALDAKVLYLPKGTANDFAKSLKVQELADKDIDKLQLIVDNSAYTNIPVMKCNDKYFINVGSFGLPAEVTDSGKGFLKEVIGKASYYINAFNQLFSDKTFDIKINSLNEIKSIKGFMISQGAYVGGGVKCTTSFGPNFRENFNFITTVANSVLSSVETVIQVNNDQAHASETLITEYYERMNISVSQNIKVKLDGEDYNGTSFEIIKLKNKLKFLLY